MHQRPDPHKTLFEIESLKNTLKPREYPNSVDTVGKIRVYLYKSLYELRIIGE